jgi:hypothetical protein
MNINVIKNRLKISTCLLLVISVPACGLNPHNAAIDNNETLPEIKTTVYDDAIAHYGMMQNIYDVRRDASTRDDKTDYTLRVMVKDIADVTGTAGASQYEIPQNVTEMVNSTLNGIGGRILYIPFDAAMMANLKNLSYSDFALKKVPDVIISGGITEFDRGLVTKGESTDLGFEIGKNYGLEGSDQIKASLSSITLDFNLIDFKTQTGIPKMQAINSVKVHKSTREDSIGFTIKSATFGAKGDIKTVQGRHAAVRLIVQLSMLQILGRYQKLPYWTLLPGADRDDVVINQVLNDFYDLPESSKIKKEQEYLYLHGYGVSVTGQMDTATQNALDEFSKKSKLNEFAKYTADTQGRAYLALFESVPVDADALRRRKSINSNAAFTPVQLPTPRVAESQASTQTGSVRIFTDKNSYRIGQAMKVSFTVDKPMYIRVVVVNSKGEISTLLPNDYQPSDLLQPNITYAIPPQNADFSLDIGLPIGTDKIHAIASQNPIPAQDIVLTSSGELSPKTIARYPVHATTKYAIQR